MKIRAAILGVVLVIGACGPKQPDPPVGTFGDAWWQTLVQAVKQIIGTAPDNTNIDCSVVLFDQSVRSTDFRAFFTPVRRPNDIFAWIQGCFGHPIHHTVPTTKASGQANKYPPNDPNKKAVCWASASFAPDGDMRFPCYFDRNTLTSWVLDLRLSIDGYMAVGW